MKFKLPLLKHQQEALDHSGDTRDMALFWGMGSGKTCGTISILRKKYYEKGRLMRTLIFAPSVVLFNWKDEFEKHSWIKPEDIHVIHGSKSKRLKILSEATEGHQIIIVNYEAVARTKEIYNILHDWEPEIVVLDESHKVKSHNSSQSIAAMNLCDLAEHRYILTGTFILNTELDAFMQYRCLDMGETFGENFFAFRRKYFYDAVSGANVSWSKWMPVQDEGLSTELREKIHSKARVVKTEDCIDLPPLVKTIKYVEMNKDQERMYKEMKDNFVAFIRDNEEDIAADAAVADTALTKLLRLQQIVTGYVVTDEGEEHQMENVPRVKYTQELLEQLTPEHKVIVWCCWRNNYKTIADICKKLNIDYVKLEGSMSNERKHQAINKFRSDGSCRVIIANRRSGGIGINLTEASHSIVFSRNFSLDEELQSAARNYRKGSDIHERIVRIDLCSKGTVDELILNALRDKREISRGVVEWTREIGWTK